MSLRRLHILLCAALLGAAAAQAADPGVGDAARPSRANPLQALRTPVSGMAPPVSALPPDAATRLEAESSASPADTASGSSRAGSALAGALLLARGGLGSLLLGLIVLAAGAWTLRRLLGGEPARLPLTRTEPSGWMPAPPPQAHPVPPIAPSTPDGGALRLPPGFDLSAFLRESRLSFVRLRAANDRADIADLREFTTPQMFAALALQIQERRGTPRQVEVMALDAQLLDLNVEQDEAVASVRFHGTAREEQGLPEPFTEVWHVRKPLSDPRSAWLLDAIQTSS